LLLYSSSGTSNYSKNAVSSSNASSNYSYSRISYFAVSEISSVLFPPSLVPLVTIPPPSEF